MNKLIVIEGTDCSGKETQTKLLMEHLKKDNIPVQRFSFPNYTSPTGKIVGGSYLGKESIGKCLFEEGAVNVDPKVASLYYAADRKYNVLLLEKILKDSNLILDRYVESNMAHQGGKIKSKEERFKMYEWLEQLEYGLLELPKPDIVIFLYVPHEYAMELEKNRTELDQHEQSKDHLKSSEEAYLELADLHQYKKINCIKDGKLRTIEDIHKEIYQYIKEKIKD